MSDLQSNHKLQRQLRGRYRRILRFFFPLIMDIFFKDVFLPALRLRRRRQSEMLARYQRSAVAYRELATDLGGIWIKVGQFLSSRLDVLPAEIIQELSGLQDEVLPEDFEQVQQVIETEWQQPVIRRIASIETEPLASASLGQVHRAVLQDQTPVAIKVQRADIKQYVEVDLRALRLVLSWLKRYKPIAKRADLDALYDEFADVVHMELDYVREAEHLLAFREMYAGDPEILIPAVYQAFSGRRVLVMEDVYAIKITDFEDIRAAGIDPADVAARLINAYLRQIFEEEIFHADPHPGNLFVEPQEDGSWRLVFVDFGMVGQLPETVKAGIRELLVAVSFRDMDRLMTAYQDLGLILPGADLERIKQAEGELMERFWGKSVREITQIDPREMHDFAHEYMDLLYELPIQVPVDLLFLGRCVAILSGICTGLDPEFNPFEWFVPYAEKLVGSGSDWFRELLQQLRKQGAVLLELPGKINDALVKLGNGELIVMARPAPELQIQFRRMATLGPRIIAAILSTGFMATAAILYVGAAIVPAQVVSVLAMLAIGYALWPRRSPH